MCVYVSLCFSIQAESVGNMQYWSMPLKNEKRKKRRKKEENEWKKKK